ncbi:hypothetical protein MMC25_005029 [Agyrium rufum]|nr:hypothetical protein [Agyrium rufum]
MAERALQYTALPYQPMSYLAPHQRDLPSPTLFIVQQYQEMMGRRPMPPKWSHTFPEHYLPRMNELAAKHDCVKHSMIALAAFVHARVTSSDLSNNVLHRHSMYATSILRGEVERFTPHNAEAIMTASMTLASQAQDWKQWTVYNDGFFTVLRYAQNSMLRSLFPTRVRTFDFQMLNFHGATTQPSCGTTRAINSDPQKDASAISQSLTNIKETATPTEWSCAGFDSLTLVVQSVQAALAMTDERHQYHGLALLRSWMFWMDSPILDDGDMMARLMLLHFYATVLVAATAFPPVYAEFLTRQCLALIFRLRIEMNSLGYEVSVQLFDLFGGLLEQDDTCLSGSIEDISG